LTDREVEVLRFICQGYTNAQIAETLIVTTNTIKTHTSNLYGKLGVRNRAQAVLRAQELHFI
jgi:ATP/maltotriose-dependent transcriptional regulator MalT